MDKIKSPPFQLKAVTLVLGTVIMGVACHSYFESEWNNIRDSKRFRLFCDEESEEKCPSLVMETFFISITIAFFILSIANFLASFSYNSEDDKTKYLEMGFHVLTGVLVFIGAILNLYSANRIRVVVEAANDGYDEISRNYMQFYNEKIAASALSLANACVYFSIGFLIFQTLKKGQPNKNIFAGKLPPDTPE